MNHKRRNRAQVGGGGGGGLHLFSNTTNLLLNSIAKDLDCMLHDLNEPSPHNHNHHHQHQHHHHHHHHNKQEQQHGHSATSLPYTKRTTSGVIARSNGNQQQQSRVSWSGRTASINPRRRSGISEHTIPRLAHEAEPTPPSRTTPSSNDVVVVVGSSGDGTTDTIINAPLVLSPAIRMQELASIGGGKDHRGSDSSENGVHEGVREETVASPSEERPQWENLTYSENESDYGQPCSISLLERLILTHPVWFLRGIYRAGAVHLLQGKEIGNFIIRQSSQANTMAITVRLPEEKGPYIEHYLVEAIGNKLRLEGSDNHFSAIPMLVAHYCQCCDELPVQLTLPRIITETTTKQELSSLALLGQEFWVSSLASPQRSPLKSPKPIMPLPATTATVTNRPHLTTFGSPPMSTFKDTNNMSSSSSSASISSFASSSRDAITSPTSNGQYLKRTSSGRPDPPPRWYSISPTWVTSPVGNTRTNTTAPISVSSPANFTVTTTVTFHVNQCTATLPVEVESRPIESEGEVVETEVIPEPTLTTTTTATLTRKGKMSPPRPPVVPCIESPPGYHCSSVADKASDYEDIWIHSPSPVSNEPPCLRGEQLKVVNALRALEAASQNSTQSWDYVGSENQTDQEKVLARNSQENCENEKENPIVTELKSGQHEARNKLGLILVPVPQVPVSTKISLEGEPRKMQSPFYSEPLDSLNPIQAESEEEAKKTQTNQLINIYGHHVLEQRHSDPSKSSQPKETEKVVDDDDVKKSLRERFKPKPPIASSSKIRIRDIRHQLSSSLTDLHSKDSCVRTDLGGGVVNVGFSSSSSQLLVSRGLGGVKDTAAIVVGDDISSENTKRATLPRATQPNKTTPKRPLLLQRFTDLPIEAYPLSTATTLTKQHGKSFNEASWRLDSSWEWYSKHCGSMPSDTESSSEDDDECVVDVTDDDEVGLVQMRSKGTFVGPRFPVMRPPGGYLTNSFLSNSMDNSGATVTIEELLTQKQPQLKVPEIKPLTVSNLLRVSEYDNMQSDESDGDEEEKGIAAVVTSMPNTSTPIVANKVSERPLFSSKPIKPAMRTKKDFNVEAVEIRTHRFQQTSSLRVSQPQRKVPSETGSSATEFSEPWDSSQWEQLLMQAATNNKLHATGEKEMVVSSEIPDVLPVNEVFRCEKDKNQKKLFAEKYTELIENDLNRTVEQVRRSLEGPSEESLLAELNGCDSDTQSSITLQNDNDESFEDFNDEQPEGLQKIPALPCLLSLRRKDRHLGRPIRDYVFKMAQDLKLIFGQHIENFIQCTRESNETDPHIMMRNIRQFMSGMANFLVNSGEGKFSTMVQEERAKLKPNEFLNLDTILEGVLHKIVVRPLKKHLCHLFVKEYTANGAVSMLSDSIKFARTRTPEQLGIKPDLRPLQGQSMEMVKYYLTKLQRAYSPLKKLENLLAIISIIYQSILQDRGGHPQTVGADDFLPMLTYVLVHCGLIASEIEAEYMWGLLHPSLLSGEGGYYLTTLSSAVHVLKHLQRSHTEGTLSKMALCLSELDGFMKVFIPDEQNGNIISKTVPIRPNMTTRDICKMVAHRLSVSNPQDYALYKLVNGEENILSELTCPWLVKMELVSVGMDCVFAYKRMDAKIAWPVNFKRS